MSYPGEHGMARPKIITTSDPKQALISITKRNCLKMHAIANLMSKVNDARKMPEFESARTGEELDAIMDHLIYLLECEANCGVGVAAIVRDGHQVELIDYDDKTKKE